MRVAFFTAVATEDILSCNKRHPVIEGSHAQVLPLPRECDILGITVTMRAQLLLQTTSLHTVKEPVPV